MMLHTESPVLHITMWEDAPCLGGLTKRGVADSQTDDGHLIVSADKTCRLSARADVSALAANARSVGDQPASASTRQRLPTFLLFLFRCALTLQRCASIGSSHLCSRTV